MDRSLPAVPGWYVDVDDSARLRHWSGWGWDLHSRRRPEWMRQTRVFAVRRAELADGAGPSPDGKVDLEALRATCLPAAAGSARLGPGRTHPTVVPVGVGGDASRLGQQQRTRHVTSIRVVRPRRAARRAPLMAATAVLGVIAVLLVAVLGTTRTPLTTAGDDTAAFTHAANIDCSSAGAARTTPTTGQIPSVAAVTAANASLGRLRSRLRALSASYPTVPAVAAWLREWDAYAGDRLAAAVATTRPAGASAAATDERRAAAEASAADRFALANSLGECTLGTPASSLRNF